MSTADEVLESGRIAICVGSGGVGKTTVAAAIAVEAARRGRRSLVLTIDPARRLADALGVAAIGNQPTALSSERAAELDIAHPGTLHAVMLDMKLTFDDLVDRFAESATARRRILDNPLYQHVSDALAGSAEYAAMEKVYELFESGRFDLIVVDTPPSQHAMDFLSTPQRLLEFLDSRLVQLLLHPAFAAGRFGFRVFHRTTQRALGVLERLSGVSFLEDVSEFLLAFEGMSEGFRTRARRVHELLLGPAGSFVLVAGPTAEAARAAVRFLAQLEDAGATARGVVVNRVRLWPDADTPPAALEGDLRRAQQDLAKLLAPESADRDEAERAAAAALEVAKGYASQVRMDEQSVHELLEAARQRDLFFRRVPEFERDVHDLAGLSRVASHIFSRAAESSDGSAAAGRRSRGRSERPHGERPGRERE